jgi:HlyD family secretion protein
VNTPRWNSKARLPLLLAGLAVIVATLLGLRELSAPRAVSATIATEPVSRKDISQTVEATGTVQAVEVVEIKSKASGQILQMPVEIGSVVKTGDLLVQIDPLTVRNQYAQALAAEKAAEADVQVTAAQKQRADELLSREAMTAVDHDAAVLAAANALASLARAQSDLEIARQALNDATVRAPSNGTVVEQDVTRGMVITSATSSPSGGTTILKMADLNRIEMNVLVGETDIGSLAPDMSARVTVDAFPNRPFTGRVIKIEPQAIVQQSVTMFPVLVAIDNENGLLLPGMNGEVTIDIALRSQALAVPLDAIRTVRELPAIALALGLNADSLKAQIQRQLDARLAARAMASTDTSAGTADTSQRAAGASRAGGHRWSGGGGRGAGAAAGNRAGRSGNGSGSGAATAARGARAQFVMVQTAAGLEPRLVRIGISDFDYSEVLSGVHEGEPVVLLSVAEQTAKRKAQQAQIAQRVGNGLPGSGGAGAGGGRGGAGGGR